jgi:hypothetical protein
VHCNDAGNGSRLILPLFVIENVARVPDVLASTTRRAFSFTVLADALGCWKTKPLLLQNLA